MGFQFLEPLPKPLWVWPDGHHGKARRIHIAYARSDRTMKRWYAAYCGAKPGQDTSLVARSQPDVDGLVICPPCQKSYESCL